MKKIIFILFSIFCFTFSYTSPAYASNFLTDYGVSYSVSDNASTHVSLNVTLTNTTSDYYASSYNIKVGFKDIKNVSASDPDGSITPKITKNASGEDIGLDFNKRVVGNGNKLNFNLSFDTDEVAQSNGSVWEVNIPGLSNQSDFSTFNVTVSYPSFLGRPAYIKPDISNAISKSRGNSLSFSKGDLGTGGISIAFGQYQIYAFNLTYHLENQNLFPITTEIALPPNTNYQDISLQNITPKPNNVYIDQNGNWLVKYSLLPSQTIKVTASGKAKVYLNPKKENPSTKEYLNKNLEEQKYWETSDSKIKSLASQLKTPRSIYDYVVGNLSYDFSRVVDEKPRIGASKVLQNTTSAVCLEFTDLFVTLARAAGIPAREIDGFANTKNTQERPLSLVKDVLHAWPQYYDKDSESWITVDPTWGNTTNGIDYFNTLDFDHFTFVVKGTDSSYPVPAGGYKRQQDISVKDVDVEVANNFEGNQDLQISVSLPKEVSPWEKVTGTVRIKNLGSEISDIGKLTLSSGFLSPKNKIISVSQIPPYGYIDIPIGFDSPSILTKNSDTITIALGKNSFRQKILVSPFITKNLILGGIFLVAAIFLSIIIFTSRRIFLRKR